MNNLQKNEEISYKIPIPKDSFLIFLNIIIAISFSIIITYVLSIYLKQEVLNVLLVALITRFTFNGITWKQKGQRILVIDSKYFIFFDRMMAISKQKVFLIDCISNLEIDKDYKYNFKMKIKSFWTRGAVGCISFSYEGKKIFFGDSFTVEEAEKLILVLKEKQFMKKNNLQ